MLSFFSTLLAVPAILAFRVSAANGQHLPTPAPALRPRHVLHIRGGGSIKDVARAHLLAIRQLYEDPEQQWDPDCASDCASFRDYDLAFFNQDDEGSIAQRCSASSFDSLLTCAKCDAHLAAAAPHGLSSLVIVLSEQCATLGYPLEDGDLDTGTIPTSSMAETYTPNGRDVHTVDADGLDDSIDRVFGDCSEVCDGGCGKNDSLLCRCSQTYFDSLYSCYACQNALLGASQTVDGPDNTTVLNDLQQECYRAGYLAITTQTGIPASYTGTGRTQSAHSTGTLISTSIGSSSGGRLAAHAPVGLKTAMLALLVMRAASGVTRCNNVEWMHAGLLAGELP